MGLAVAIMTKIAPKLAERDIAPRQHQRKAESPSLTTTTIATADYQMVRRRVLVLVSSWERVSSSQDLHGCAYANEDGSELQQERQHQAM
jgi:hypothetical protein